MNLPAPIDYRGKPIPIKPGQIKPADWGKPTEFNVPGYHKERAIVTGDPVVLWAKGSATPDQIASTMLSAAHHTGIGSYLRGEVTEGWCRGCGKRVALAEGDSAHTIIVPTGDEQYSQQGYPCGPVDPIVTPYMIGEDRAFFECDGKLLDGHLSWQSMFRGRGDGGWKHDLSGGKLHHVPCRECGGEGSVLHDDGESMYDERCGACNGTGHDPNYEVAISCRWLPKRGPGVQAVVHRRIAGDGPEWIVEIDLDRHAPGLKHVLSEVVWHKLTKKKTRVLLLAQMAVRWWEGFELDYEIEPGGSE